ILRGVRQQQDEPGRFSICSRQAAVVHHLHALSRNKPVSHMCSFIDKSRQSYSFSYLAAPVWSGR
ncbi:hypothetical protein C4Z33_018245, partial [Klebsiella pneumoniae subsp. pneumoniae]